MTTDKAFRGGMTGHESPRMRTDVWLTPPGVLAELGPFDLDPCAAPEPRPWPTARTHWTQIDEPLERDWFGRVWLNPPYGNPKIVGPWLRKMVQHNCGTALIFARTETALFFETVWESATAIFFFCGRLSFHPASGAEGTNNAGAPSCLVAYGADDADVLEHDIMMPGKFVRLR